MPAAKNLDQNASPLAFFGAQLRKLRLRAGLTQEQLGQRVNYSADLIGKIETAKSKPSDDFLKRCDEALDTGGLLTELWEYLRDDRYPSWLGPWIEAERKSRVLRSWQPLVIPGLLQTPDYARELLREQPGVTEDRLDELVATRLERQAIISRDNPPLLWFVIAEGVLRSEIGGPGVMREQLQALLEVSRKPHVKLLVVPASAGAHPGLDGAFGIASFNDAPDVVYLESVGEGQVSDRPEDVRAVTDAYDAIRAKALPDRASQELIAKVMEQWT